MHTYLPRKTMGLAHTIPVSIQENRVASSPADILHLLASLLARAALRNHHEDSTAIVTAKNRSLYP